MKLCLILILLTIIRFGNGSQIKTTQPYKYLTKPTNDITIKIMVHIDKELTRKLIQKYGLKTRKKLKNLTHGILENARKLFMHPSLNQTINFKLLDTRFLRNSKVIAMDENAPKYLSSYCDWQSKKKMSERSLYYSVLLTGLDLFHVNDGKLIRSNSGRGYTRGMCSVRKSCALIEWDPRTISFLLAHEIGHSLGMRHDGPPYNQCSDQKNIMAIKYDESHHPKSWSPCSWFSLRQFLKTSKAWCVRTEHDRRNTLKHYVSRN
ncbi:A disintegrin and metalloproteinase with thrombospondin motifs adt-2-like [Nymphalis io]|uniref:A disintegrin and metalloproteinase with thrombospondin motifs adt-2-like n=1 Tax=Inachis io TaxID=171585 RepID=UPI002169EDC7|nr:A disintegrin and metalloproteinase with thrombospondin motifs adt-2-like [Nymphalis io]